MQMQSGRELLEQLGADYFKQGSTFGALSDEAISYLVEEGEIIQLDAGDVLFRYGDLMDGFYVVINGTIELSGLYLGKTRSARDFTFGEQLGFVGMISLEGAIGDAKAQEKSLVLKVSGDQFYRLHETLPNDFGILMLNLTREIARRIRELFIKHHQ